jgi:hypothetical protein
METNAHTVLVQWEGFYVIVGSSAGALTGLMFVVITLVREAIMQRSLASINSFGTPNVIHFVAVLLIASILSAPWMRLKDPAHLIGLMAIAGVIYVLIVWRRMKRQTDYKLVLEDWVWHLILPLIAYVALFVSAAGISHDQMWALFVAGGVSLLLVCIGIHNAWDTVTYVVMAGREEARKGA